MTQRFLACIMFTLLCIIPPASAQSLEFQKVFEQHGVVMMLIDPNTGVIVDANPAAAQFYGHERDELKTMTIQQINTLSAAQVAEERTLAKNEGRNYFIFRHRLADGETRTVEVHSNPFTIAGLPLLLSLIHDITPGRNLEQGMWNYQQRLEQLVEARTVELEARHLQITLLQTGSLLIVSIIAIMLFLGRAKRQRCELDLRQQKGLLKSLLDSTPDFIFYKNLEGVYQGCNRHFAELVNKKEQDIIGKVDYDLFDKETADLFREQDRLMMKQGQTRRNDEWVTWPDGQQVLLDTLKTTYRGPDDEIIGLLGISRDITERKQAEEVIKTAHKQLQTKNSLLDALSKTDQLTGIANRRRTQQVIDQEINRFNRYKKPFCIFLFDIDHFKAVNDNHGHEVGDQVLVELVGLVQSVIRQTDTLGRWGGEEFILVCPETSLPTARTIAEKICTAVREYQFAQGLGITLSIGVSEIQSGATLKEILVEVDRKMYLAKQKGRNRVEW